MDEPGKLLALTRAAEACNAAARNFIELFGTEPVYSTIGGQLERWAAGHQAAGHLRSADLCAERIERHIHDWDAVYDALYWVSTAVGISHGPFIIDSRSYHTAHEAARYLAEAVLDRYHRIEGDDNIERCRVLADRLSELAAALDLYGFIEGESFAAQQLIPLPPAPPTNTDRIAYKEIADIAGVSPKTVFNRASEWKNEYPELADQIFDGCSYAVIQSLIVNEWPKKFDGVDYKMALEIARNRASQ